MKREIKPTTYMRSGRVTVKYIRLPTSRLYKVLSQSSPNPSLFSKVPGTIGTCTSLLFHIWKRSSTSLAYFAWHNVIPLLSCRTSTPRKYFISPKSVISNSFCIDLLKASHII
ncbi:hypothetical protein Hanom_Chr03g00256781 [Helianthus anomalus]